MYIKLKRGEERRVGLSKSHTIIKGTEWFLLWHLKPSWPWILQVGCSSAEGLVIWGGGRDLARAGGAVTEGKGMTDGPKGECQNHKSNLSLTPSSNKLYLHFHIASTFKTSMFRHFKAAWRAHLSFHRAFKEDSELGLVCPILTCQTVCSYPPLTRITHRIFY